eukprot:TRINITY_DN936_c0_g1_i5.p1 TRINITY_DN936_c0_g1~~TRINITY_DN936_c0_g1_i5.p1  ORF type:complete len:349 (+),score=125.03 TRINITY_DN936_c0_g1_i5:134-1048(+)
MKALNHQNIVNLREVLASKSKLYIVMDLVRGGELFDTIERQGELDEALARKYFQQLVDGIHYCHRRGVCHRDLKPENLLVDEDGALKITDFGVSSMRGGAGGGASDLLYTACGTPYYCAPEIISGAEEGYSGVKIDAWSCGIILYLLVTGELPFLHDDMPRLYELINGCKVPYPPWMGGDVKDLISRLLVKDPARRYALEDVKKHVWFLVDYAPADAPTDSGRAGGSLESTDSDRPKHRATKNLGRLGRWRHGKRQPWRRLLRKRRQWRQQWQPPPRQPSSHVRGTGPRRLCQGRSRGQAPAED